MEKITGDEPVKNVVSSVPPIPIAVSFLDWVSFERYMRLSEKKSHKWFKVGCSSTYTTIELFEKFVNEMNEEVRNTESKEYLVQLEFEANRINGL